MNLDNVWADLDAGISTRSQEGPFCCASCKEEIKPNPWPASPFIALLVILLALGGWYGMDLVWIVRGLL